MTIIKSYLTARQVVNHCSSGNYATDALNALTIRTVCYLVTQAIKLILKKITRTLIHSAIRSAVAACNCTSNSKGG
jgi:hypothetical protein